MANANISMKRKAWKVSEKLTAVDRVRNGESQAKVSRDLGVAESTLRGWIKEETKLRNFVHTIDEGDGLNRKRARLAQDETLDTALYKWFVQTQHSGVPLSGPIISAQAEQFDRQINGDSSQFRASSGWLWHFCKRHGISQVSIRGETRSANQISATSYPSELKELIEAGNYAPEQIYNADETGVYYKMLPDKTLAVKSQEQNGKGFKAIKERVTLLFAVNKTGSHKVKPLCIGKSKSPRCFHHVNMKALPFSYANSKNAWMTSAIFEDWFHKEFAPSVRKHLRSLKLPEKALLLLDNCPAHPPAEMLKTRDGLIKVSYLPKNTTSLIQPLDQGVIATFKQNYRRELITNIVSGEKSVTEYLKAMTLKDFVYNGALAWQRISARNIEGCWMRGLGAAFQNSNAPDESENEEESTNQSMNSSSDEQDSFEFFTEEEVEEVYARQAGRFRKALADDGLTVTTDDVNAWINFDDPVPTAELLTDDEIVEASSNVPGPSGDDDESDDDSEAEQLNAQVKATPTAAETVEHLEQALLWFETTNIDSVRPTATKLPVDC